MATEQQEKGKELESKSEEQEEDAAFASGFSEEQAEMTPGGKRPEEKKPQAEEKKDPPRSEEKKEDPPPEKKLEEETVTITKAQLDLLLAGLEDGKKLKSAMDKVNGTLGAYKQQIDTLGRLAQPTQVEITDADFEELIKDFPEVADATRKGLQRILKNMRGGGAPSQVDEGAVKKLIVDSAIQRETEVLEDEFEDWKKIVGDREDKDNDFRKWLSGQPVGYQTKINSTFSGAVIARSIRRFQADAKKASDEQRAKDEKAEADRKSQEEAEKRKATDARRGNLRAAVQPRGDGGGTPQKREPTEDDEFEAGFKEG